MILRAARSQWVKLTRRGVLAPVLGASLVFSVLATVVTLVTASDGPSAQDRPGLPSTTRAALARADGIVVGLGQAGQFLGIVALAVGAFAVASEYQHGTLRNLLVRQPRRIVLLGGSSLAAGALLAAAAVLATVGATLTALLVAPGAGVDTGAWSATEILFGLGRAAVNMLGYGLLGAVLGLLLRSPLAAVGVGVAYVLPVESILGAISHTTDDLLPGKLLSAVADGSASSTDVAVLGAWALAAVAVGTVVFARRDVSA